MPARNNIIFESFFGKQYSDNPKSVYNYIKNNFPEYDLYWSMDRRHKDRFQIEDVKSITRLTPKWIYLMATAKYWVVNSRLPSWIPKPKHTVYLQTWHGTPLKKLGIDIENVSMADTNTKEYKREFLKEAEKWDYLISANKYSSEIFRRAFGYKGKIIESGYPRNDYLYAHNNIENIAEVKSKLNLPKAKKVILYAPTWRDNDFYHTGRYKFNLNLDFSKLKESLGDDYIILLRMHYLIAENLNIEDFTGFVYDCSSYNDINELYLISDFLITDYSSVFFDYANLGRPMLFYVYDMEDYRDNLRGFYFDFEEKAPGPLVKTTEEIITEVKKVEKEGFVPSETTKDFYDKFCYLEDEHAAERVVKEVFKLN